MSQTEVHKVDVLVVGAGPVGLLTAYQLVKQTPDITLSLIERYPKNTQDTYGRAITLYPRSSEMLDQLGLADDLAQQCFACRDTVTYNSKGEEVAGRGWNFMQSMRDTYWDFALVLRQRFQEEVFRKALGKLGVEVEAPTELVAVKVDESVALGGYRVTATVLDVQSQTTEKVQCKYLIGCDGGRSAVRRLSGIPFEGAATEDRWVRVDGLVKTNVPKPRTYCSIESPTHGNVLWVGLDRGTTRIGYAFTADRAKDYKTFDEAAAVKEAIAAVKPFELEFERVDWWTIYSIGQRIAEHFYAKDCIFLAGDAAHTHSSGAAQGMNTGIHDAVNLSWKLSLVLRGLANRELLHSYEAERLPNVQKLIQYDKDISQLMTNRLPEFWTGDPKADVNDILGRLMEEAGTFSSGLGIRYDARDSLTASYAGSFESKNLSEPVLVGGRAPDVTLLNPGTYTPTRLISETPNVACFYIVVFVGDYALASESAYYEAASRSPYMLQKEKEDLVKYLTIMPAKCPSPYEVLGHEPLGRVFFDDEQKSIFQRYGVEKHTGAIFVIRPDGWVGTSASLEAKAAEEVEIYLKELLV